MEQIQRESTVAGQKEQLANYIRGLKSHSEQHFTSNRKEFPELYNLYRGTLNFKFSPHRNSVHIPLIFSTIHSDVARKTQASFGTWPAVGFVGYSSEDAPIARKREALVNAQMKDCGMFKKAYDLFLTSDLYGTAIAWWGWTRIDEMIQVTYPDILPVTGETIMIVDNKTITTFDGPDLKIIDPLDAFPQPGFRDVESMDWFIIREYASFDRLREQAETGPNGRPIYDPTEVRRLQTEDGSKATTTDDYKNWRNVTRNLMEEDARKMEQWGRPVELWHYFGKVPHELAPDGLVNRFITVANEKFLVRNRPNPFWNGKKPILTYSPNPDPHYFWAPGKAEIAKKLQIVANKFTNQQLDALDLFIDPIFVHNTDANLNTDNLFIRPGAWIGVEGIPQEQVMPLIPNLSGIQIGGQMTEILWRWMQQGLGIVEDVVMGGPGTRQTAREFLGRSEAVATRLLRESRSFEEDFLEPLSDIFVDLDRQFLTGPKEVFILGQSAQVDPVTKLPIPTRTREYVDGWDLLPNYEARAVGASTKLGRGMRQKALTFLMQAAGQNPMAMTAINWVTFLRDVFRTFEMDNIDELVNSPSEQEKMMILMNQGARPPAEMQQTEVPGTPNQAMQGSIPNMVGAGVIA